MKISEERSKKYNQKYLSEQLILILKDIQQKRDLQDLVN